MCDNLSGIVNYIDQYYIERVQWALKLKRQLTFKLAELSNKKSKYYYL